jgi:propionyl-CoA carboxylase alpha chain
MFKKILIANRGEIACRVMRTAKRMGIKTVAVYSEADAGALHVDMADEAVLIGPPPAAQSYLVIDNIVNAIESTGADAAHPGYGFLSENMKFAEALEKIGVTFIGPPAKAIFAMGDKIESKKLAKEAGVSSVPGYLGVIKDAEEAVKIAKEIGYPVMVKASAGGGGKGMRLAASDGEVRDGFRSASNEARASFGDDRVFIEKFIQQPRHIEIQVLGDKHGTVLYLGERECSVQRRHQKVIEEAPSPLLDAKTRTAMGEQAVALAKAVGYYSAGTVEFVADQQRNFYFLEMNTRLQVEHPVTELVTGLDLVEQMIRVAAGEKLAFGQKDVKLDGWAIESRIYAEDPYRNFLPSIGRLTHYKPPVENGAVRNDTGVGEGGEISIHYDPMIAKLCTKGKDRAEAVQRMRVALDDFYVRGIAHNVPFLSAVMANPVFQSGKLSTAFIAEQFPDGFKGVTPDAATRDRLIAIAAYARAQAARREVAISGQMPHRKPGGSEDWVARIGAEEFPLRVSAVDEGDAVSLGDRHMPIEGRWKPGDPVFRGTVDGVAMAVALDRRPDGFRVNHSGVTLDILVRTPRAAELARFMPEKRPPDTSKFLLSPMPGLVVSIEVAEGEEVKAGQPLAIVDAMKMENVLKAERDGKVSKVHVKPKDSVAVDQVLLEFA